MALFSRMKRRGLDTRPAVAVAVVLALLLAGCGGASLAGDGEHVVIMPDTGQGQGSDAAAPPSADGGSAPVIVPDPSDERVTLTLFFPSATGIPGPGPWPWRRTIERPERLADLARTALENLLSPPPDSPFLPALPEGTRVLSVEVDESKQIAYANFSRELVSNHIGGSFNEGNTVHAIVQTLTGLPGIRHVQILVEGKVVDSLAGHIAVNRPLARLLIVPGPAERSPAGRPTEGSPAGGPATGSPANATTMAALPGEASGNDGGTDGWSPWNMETDGLVLDYFQEQVNQGRMQWLTDPVEAARYLATTYGFVGWDEFVLLHRAERGEGSGRGEALVRVRHGDTYYTIHMVQPRVQGEKGIWVVRDVRSRAVATGRQPVDEKVARSWQQEVDAGNNLWRLDPVDTVRRNGGLYGFDRYSDEFSLVEVDREAGRALVRVKHDGREYDVRLTQPARRGQRGIWWIEFIAPAAGAAQP
ncbi:MAG TPA: GerMN domain-containing protein [Thermaerobacter sp.]